MGTPVRVINSAGAPHIPGGGQAITFYTEISLLPSAVAAGGRNISLDLTSLYLNGLQCVKSDLSGVLLPLAQPGGWSHELQGRNSTFDDSSQGFNASSSGLGTQSGSWTNRSQGFEDIIEGLTDCRYPVNLGLGGVMNSGSILLNNVLHNIARRSNHSMTSALIRTSRGSSRDGSTPSTNSSSVAGSSAHHACVTHYCCGGLFGTGVPLSFGADGNVGSLQLRSSNATATLTMTSTGNNTSSSNNAGSTLGSNNSDASEPLVSKMSQDDQPPVNSTDSTLTADATADLTVLNSSSSTEFTGSDSAAAVNASGISTYENTDVVGKATNNPVSNDTAGGATAAAVAAAAAIAATATGTSSTNSTGTESSANSTVDVSPTYSTHIDASQNANATDSSDYEVDMTELQSSIVAMSALVALSTTTASTSAFNESTANQTQQLSEPSVRAFSADESQTAAAATAATSSSNPTVADASTNDSSTAISAQQQPADSRQAGISKPNPVVTLSVVLPVAVVVLLIAVLAGTYILKRKTYHHSWGAVSLFSKGGISFLLGRGHSSALPHHHDSASTVVVCTTTLSNVSSSATSKTATDGRQHDDGMLARTGKGQVVFTQPVPLLLLFFGLSAAWWLQASTMLIILSYRIVLTASTKPHAVACRASLSQVHV